MKKFTLFILIALLASCKPSVQKLAVQCIKNNAMYPDGVEILSYNETLRPADEHYDTICHIAYMDGEQDMIDPNQWWWAKVAYVDSIKIETKRFPEHYYCYCDIRALNTFGVAINDHAEVAVFPDGTAMMYDQYQDIYYNAVETKTIAYRDTLTGMRDHILFSKNANGWIYKVMLYPYRLKE